MLNQNLTDIHSRTGNALAMFLRTAASSRIIRRPGSKINMQLASAFILSRVDNCYHSLPTAPSHGSRRPSPFSVFFRMITWRQHGKTPLIARCLSHWTWIVFSCSVYNMRWRFGARICEHSIASFLKCMLRPKRVWWASFQYRLPIYEKTWCLWYTSLFWEVFKIYLS